LKNSSQNQAHQAQEHEDGSGKLIKIQVVSSFNFYIKLHNKNKGENLDTCESSNPRFPLAALQEGLNPKLLILHSIAMIV
jgi:hypothetical protein